MLELNKVHLGDCIETIKKLEDNSVDAIVTDPPYELGFMGKERDGGDIAFNVELWKECLRVLKPGGHLVSFSGTRTYHRMACAIEDSGFEVRDMLEWIYASGFPKSLNVGKAVDKNKGKLNYGLYKLQEALNDERKKRGLTLKDLNILWGAPENSGMAAHKLCDKSQPQFITNRQMEIIDKAWELNGKYNSIYEEAEREFIGRGKAGLTKGSIANFSGETEFDLTKGNSEWEGFGTALKPAHEPIIMARKPLSEKTIVENVLKHGTGAIDIDGCRIPLDKNAHKDMGTFRNAYKQGAKYDGTGGTVKFGGKELVADVEKAEMGRFPANILCTDDALNDGVIQKSGKAIRSNSGGNTFGGDNKKPPMEDLGFSDTGSKSRYFDIDVRGEKHGLLQFPKASKSERNKGCEGLEEKDIKHGLYSTSYIGDREYETHTTGKNNHPTVKPIHLMSWLIRLISKPGDIVLEPFAGSGTTCVSCKMLGRNFIACELTEEYIPICEARINAVNKIL